MKTFKTYIYFEGTRWAEMFLDSFEERSTYSNKTLYETCIHENIKPVMKR